MKPPPAWRSYQPALDALMPGKVGDERRWRCGMMLLRDRTIKAREEAGWEADMILRAVQEIASAYALAPVSGSVLESVHYNLIRLVASASNIETLHVE